VTPKDAIKQGARAGAWRPDRDGVEEPLMHTEPDHGTHAEARMRGEDGRRRMGNR